MRELNHVFFHYTKDRPAFVIMKYAMTLDGGQPPLPGIPDGLPGRDAEGSMRTEAGLLLSCAVETILADDSLLYMPSPRIPGIRCGLSAIHSFAHRRIPRSSCHLLPGQDHTGHLLFLTGKPWLPL